MPLRGGGDQGRGGGGGRGRGDRRSRGRVSSKPQRGSRSVPTAEEVLARNSANSGNKDLSEDSRDGRTSSDEETVSSSERQQQRLMQPADTSSAAAAPKETHSDSDDGLKISGNPNRNPAARDSPPEPTRREREALERQKQLVVMQKLQAEGKTSRAKMDLERLAEVRRRRAEAERSRASNCS